MDIPFVGVKTGDVSGDAIGQSSLAGSRTLNSEIWNYEFSEENGLAKIEIKAERDMVLSGYQGELSWSDNAVYETMVPGVLQLSDQHLNTSYLNTGKLRMAFNSADELLVKEGDVLMTLFFHAIEHSVDIDLSFEQSRLQSEVYENDEASRLLLEKVEPQPESYFRVYSNHPNPWSELTYIKADVPVAGQLLIRIYDVHNRLMHKESHKVSQGTHSFTIGEQEIESSGLYFYELELDGQVSPKMTDVDKMGFSLMKELGKDK